MCSQKTNATNNTRTSLKFFPQQSDDVTHLESKQFLCLMFSSNIHLSLSSFLDKVFNLEIFPVKKFGSPVDGGVAILVE